MKKLCCNLLLVIFVLTLSGCSSKVNVETQIHNTGSGATSTTQSTVTSTQEKKHIIITHIPAPSLKDNTIGEKTEQQIYILLPPTYYESNKKYPVVYYLHGYGSNSSAVATFVQPAQELMKDGKIQEFILVGVNGINKYGGSFYTNSPVTGNWEDHITKDVIRYIDSNFKTLAKAESRGIVGFSMGGYGAINIAFKHPDKYSSVFALAPGLFDEKGLDKAYHKSWDDAIKTAYGAAFSPNPGAKDIMWNMPKFDGSTQDQKIITEWENGFGNLTGKIDAYKNKQEKLKAIKIEYGRVDRYEWIPDGCKYFSQLLDSHGIKHSLAEFEGGHSLSSTRVQESILPFFSENLKFQ